MPCRRALLLLIADEDRVGLRVNFNGRLVDLGATRGRFGRWTPHAVIFMRFLVNMARTNLSHFAIAARFSGM